jgi:hypothetical protein
MLEPLVQWTYKLGLQLEMSGVRAMDWPLMAGIRAQLAARSTAAPPHLLHLQGCVAAVPPSLPRCQSQVRHCYEESLQSARLHTLCPVLL